MKQRQFPDTQAQQFRKEAHELGVDLERAIMQRNGILDPRLARKYIADEVQLDLWITAVIFGRSMTNPPEELFKIWKGLRKAD